MRSTFLFVLAAAGLTACTDATAPIRPTLETAATFAGAASSLTLASPVSNYSVTVSNGWAGLNLPARLWTPTGPGPFKAVVAMHGCGGLMLDSAATKVGTEFLNYGKALADSGYVALFLDSFTPRGILDGVCNDTTKINEAVARVQDAYSGMAWLKQQGWVISDSISILGWSNGGSASLSAIAKNNNPVDYTATGKFTQALVYYPGCGLRNQYGGYTSGTWTPYAPTRVMIGSLDNFTSNCTKRVAQGVKLGGDVTLTVYDGAQHGFNRAGQTGTWTAADYAARDAARVIVFDRLKY